MTFPSTLSFRPPNRKTFSKRLLKDCLVVVFLPKSPFHEETPTIQHDPIQRTVFLIQRNCIVFKMFSDGKVIKKDRIINSLKVIQKIKKEVYEKEILKQKILIKDLFTHGEYFYLDVCSQFGRNFN